jgi:hypothetical protein
MLEEPCHSKPVIVATTTGMMGENGTPEHDNLQLFIRSKNSRTTIQQLIIQVSTHYKFIMIEK